ncbi:MAG: transposase [Nitrospinota bacterium]
MESRVLFKGYRGHPLTAWQKRKNRRWSAVRSVIEPKMADLKRWCSMDRMRYYGLERNHLWMLACGMAANFKRTVFLSTA